MTAIILLHQAQCQRATFHSSLLGALHRCTFLHRLSRALFVSPAHSAGSLPSLSSHPAPARINRSVSVLCLRAFHRRPWRQSYVASGRSNGAQRLLALFVALVCGAPLLRAILPALVFRVQPRCIFSIASALRNTTPRTGTVLVVPAKMPTGRT